MTTLAEVEGVVVSMFEEATHDFPHVHVANAKGCPLIAVGVGSYGEWSDGDWGLLTDKQTQALQRWLNQESIWLEEAYYKIRNREAWGTVPLPENMS